MTYSVEAGWMCWNSQIRLLNKCWIPSFWGASCWINCYYARVKRKTRSKVVGRLTHTHLFKSQSIWMYHNSQHFWTHEQFVCLRSMIATFISPYIRRAWQNIFVVLSLLLTCLHFCYFQWSHSNIRESAKRSWQAFLTFPEFELSCSPKFFQFVPLNWRRDSKKLLKIFLLILLSANRYQKPCEIRLLQIERFELVDNWPQNKQCILQ